MSIHEESDGSAEGQQIGRKYTCEVEIVCRSAEECPEALFSWEFNDRPVRSLARAKGEERGGMLLRQREIFHQRRHAALPGGDNGQEVVVSQQSQLEVPAQFANGENFRLFGADFRRFL